MEDIANDEMVRKKPCQTFGGDTPPMAGRSSDFRPFQYEGKQFSDFARGIYIYIYIKLSTTHMDHSCHMLLYC